MISWSWAFKFDRRHQTRHAASYPGKGGAALFQLLPRVNAVSFPPVERTGHAPADLYQRNQAGPQ